MEMNCLIFTIILVMYFSIIINANEKGETANEKVILERITNQLIQIVENKSTDNLVNKAYNDFVNYTITGNEFSSRHSLQKVAKILTAIEENKTQIKMPIKIFFGKNTNHTNIYIEIVL